MIERRMEHYQIRLVGEGLLVGAVSGLVVLAYRVILTYAGEWLTIILAYAKGNLPRMALWFLALLLMAAVMARLVRWEPMISGSGIPQVEGEMTGKLEQCWWRILAAKFSGGFLCLLAGLSLGREGPSIQMGAMAGKGEANGFFERHRQDGDPLFVSGNSRIYFSSRVGQRSCSGGAGGQR